jgi:hypothetical protein
MKKHLLIALSGLFTLLMVSSCHKDNPTSYVEIQNDTYTTLSVILNGKSATIPSGSTLTFSASAGSGITGQATTSGGSFGPNTGVALSWDLSSYSFPPSGTVSIPIDVSSDFFYLFARNNAGYNVVRVDVNYNTTQQETDNVTIPNDGNIYGVGYYQAYNNSNVQFTLSDNPLDVYKWPSLNLPFTNNQFFNAYFP